MVPESNPGEVINRIFVFKRTVYGATSFWQTAPTTVISVPRQIGSIAVRGDLLAVGLPKENRYGISGLGSVYLYRKNQENWVLEKELRTDNTSRPYLFGTSVALGDNVIAIGEPGNGSVAYGVNYSPVAANSANFYSSNTSDTGAVYIYRKGSTTWYLENFLKPPQHSTIIPNFQFGTSLQFASNRNLLIGIPGESGAGRVNLENGQFNSTQSDPGSGAVYHYILPQPSTYISPSDPTPVISQPVESDPGITPEPPQPESQD